MRRSPYLALLFLIGFGFGCTESGYYVDPVEVCRCNPDEICVKESCALPGEPVIAPSQGDSCLSEELLINELRYSSQDEDVEAAVAFIELRGTPGQVLEGHQLVGIEVDGAVRFAFPLSGSLNQEGLWVGAFGQLNELAETELSVLGSQGLPTPSGSLLIIGCNGERVDAVSWGSFAAAEENLGEGSPAAEIEGLASLSRCPSEALSQADSDDNAADFHLGEASPGAPNASVIESCE